jgi:hypothetical protein
MGLEFIVEGEGFWGSRFVVLRFWGSRFRVSGLGFRIA